MIIYLLLFFFINAKLLKVFKSLLQLIENKTNLKKRQLSFFAFVTNKIDNMSLKKDKQKTMNGAKNQIFILLFSFW